MPHSSTVWTWTNTRDNQSPHNNYWNFGWEDPQNIFWSSNTQQGLFPSVGWGPFILRICWFLYFPYRTSLDNGHTGNSWQVASQAGNGDSLASGVQNFPEKHPLRLERIHLWYRHRGNTLVRKVLYPDTSFLCCPGTHATKQLWPCQLWAVQRGKCLEGEPDLWDKSQPHFLWENSKWEKPSLWSCESIPKGLVWLFGFRTKQCSSNGVFIWRK